MKCSIHPDKDAIARCGICHKAYCEEHIEKVGDTYICFRCLKKILKKTTRIRKPPYKALNLFLVVAASVFTILAVYIILSNIDMLPYVLEDLRSMEAKYFARQLLFAFVLFIEVLLILTSNRSALILGILLSIWFVILPFIQIPPMPLNTITILFYILLPIIAITALLGGKEGLEKEPFYKRWISR